MTLLQQIAKKRWEAMTKSLRKISVEKSEEEMKTVSVESLRKISEKHGNYNHDYDPLETFYIIVNQS